MGPRETKYSRNQNNKMADERDPAERVRRLVQYAGQVEVDNSIAPKKYFRSGVEMERMVRINFPFRIIPRYQGQYLC